MFCVFQVAPSRRATLHQQSLCLSVWRITTARPWTSSSPPRRPCNSNPQLCPPPKQHAPSPTWTCSTWRTAANLKRRPTETRTPSSGPTGQSTTRRACAMRSSRSRWGTLPAWMTSKILCFFFYWERKSNLFVALHRNNFTPSMTSSRTWAKLKRWFLLLH